MKLIHVVMTSMLLTACTYSITQVQTRGSASDVVDETATNSPNVVPTVSLPLQSI